MDNNTVEEENNISRNPEISQIGSEAPTEAGSPTQTTGAPRLPVQGKGEGVGGTGTHFEDTMGAASNKVPEDLIQAKDLISLNFATGLSRLPWRSHVGGGGRVDVIEGWSRINFASAAMNEVKQMLVELHNCSPVKNPSP